MNFVQEPQGSFPSNIETNPHVHVKAITLRSGQEIESKPEISKQGEKIATPPEKSSKEKGKERDTVPIYKPRILYSAKLKEDQSND